MEKSNNNSFIKKTEKILNHIEENRVNRKILKQIFEYNNQDFVISDDNILNNYKDLLFEISNYNINIKFYSLKSKFFKIKSFETIEKEFKEIIKKCHLNKENSQDILKSYFKNLDSPYKLKEVTSEFQFDYKIIDGFKSKIFDMESVKNSKFSIIRLKFKILEELDTPSSDYIDFLFYRCSGLLLIHNYHKLVNSIKVGMSNNIENLFSIFEDNLLKKKVDVLNLTPIYMEFSSSNNFENIVNISDKLGDTYHSEISEENNFQTNINRALYYYAKAQFENSKQVTFFLYVSILEILLLKKNSNKKGANISSRAKNLLKESEAFKEEIGKIYDIRHSIVHEGLITDKLNIDYCIHKLDSFTKVLIKSSIESFQHDNSFESFLLELKDKDM